MRCERSGGNIELCHAEVFRARAEVIDRASRTIGPARLANCPSVPDEQMRDHNPVFFLDKVHEVLFDFYRVLIARQA